MYAVPRGLRGTPFTLLLIGAIIGFYRDDHPTNGPREQCIRRSPFRGRHYIQAGR